MLKMPRTKAKMTPKWEKVLGFIRTYIKLHGVSPSYDLIAKSFGLRSRSNIHRMVRRMEEEGHVQVRPKKVYGVRVEDRTVKEVLSL